MHLYMIRHGQSFVNLPDWDGGNADAGLTELGLKQGAALGKWIPSALSKVDALYCSTMQRARETAAFILPNYDINPIYDDRLREIGNNKLDHTAWPSDALPEYGDTWGSERPFHSITPSAISGESLMHFRTRIGIFIEEIAHHHLGETVIVVCHGGVIEATHDHVFNIGPWKRCEVWTKNTGLSHFEHVDHKNRETWRLYFHNKTEHYALLDAS